METRILIAPPTRISLEEIATPLILANAGLHKQLLLAPYKTASAGTETAEFAG
jgi:hypothetical protein